jgi:hypothetical protein
MQFGVTVSCVDSAQIKAILVDQILAIIFGISLKPDYYSIGSE